MIGAKCLFATPMSTASTSHGSNVTSCGIAMTPADSRSSNLCSSSFRILLSYRGSLPFCCGGNVGPVVLGRLYVKQVAVQIIEPVWYHLSPVCVGVDGHLRGKRCVAFRTKSWSRWADVYINSGRDWGYLTCMADVFATGDQHRESVLLATPSAPSTERISWGGRHVRSGLRLSSWGSRAHSICWRDR